MNSRNLHNRYYAATGMLFLIAYPLIGKEPLLATAGIKAEKIQEPLVLERMLLAVQETAFYTQRYCELYLAVASTLFPQANTPSVQEWARARVYFRNEMLIWEEVRTTPFYRLSPTTVETQWRQL